MDSKSVNLLAGDIGGTKTNVAIVSSNSGPHRPLAEATFSSADYPSLEALVQEFCTQVDMQVDLASFGVAGPVVAGHATVTDLPWVMDEVQLAKALNLERVHLMNDLVAIANAVPNLDVTDLHTLNAGTPIANGAIAVVAPGTGLGEAYLVHDGTRYRAYPSEGGHADFAPNNELEADLLCYLRQKFGSVSWERVCSGKGIPNIYEYLKASGIAEEPDWLAAKLEAAGDPTPTIINTALSDEQTCALCTMTLNCFVSILGSETGNMALKVLATGGVYLGGGIPPRILPALQDSRLTDAFLNKGRLSELLKQIPVHVILNPKAALFGAACYGLGLG